MVTTFIALIKTVRPRQWLKNLTIYAGLVFSARLFNLEDFSAVTQAFIFFSLATSAIYIFNDLVDAPKDRLHPFKKKRPIAAGTLSVQLATVIGILFILTALFCSFILSQRFFLAVVAYLILQFSYMYYLKEIIILDVIAIASGFLLRIYAGIWVIGTHVNIWFLLCVVSFALFIAIGKRRAEATLLQGYSASAPMEKVRSTLGHYPESLLHSYTTMFATSTWVTYSLFAFQQPRITPNSFFSQFFFNLTPRVEDTKWFMVTVPVVVYGVMRYLYLIYEKKEGESPERMLLSDKPLLVSVIIWAVLTFLILYVVQG
jgi:4-hydroxybenzoate polyprenyltransferase